MSEEPRHQSSQLVRSGCVTMFTLIKLIEITGNASGNQIGYVVTLLTANKIKAE